MQLLIRQLLVVATVLTACGIETNQHHRMQNHRKHHQLQQCLPLAVLKLKYSVNRLNGNIFSVATVLTACGMRRRVRDCRGAKRWWSPHISSSWLRGRVNEKDRVNVLTVYGIETLLPSYTLFCLHHHCDSTYRLRYWNSRKRLYSSSSLQVATVLTACGIETFANVRLVVDNLWLVATVLTAYDIDTYICNNL